MPDHLHALICGINVASDLKRCITTFRQRSGYNHRRACGQRLWQDGYFDRHLRSEEATLDVISYIVCNPVRAGICASPIEYGWSGSNTWSMDKILSSVQWTPRALG